MKNNHLDDKAFAAWALDPRHDSTAEHFEFCSECRAEAVEFRQSMTAFRGALERAADDRQMRWALPAAGERRTTGSGPESWRLLPRLIPVTFLAVILLAVTLATRTPKPAPQASSAIAAGVLMNQVNNDLNQRTPEALAPAETLLADMVANPGSETSSTKNGGQNQ